MGATNSRRPGEGDAVARSYSNRDIARMAIDVAMYSTSMYSEGGGLAWTYEYENEVMCVTFDSDPEDGKVKVEWTEDFRHYEVVFEAWLRPLACLLRQPGRWEEDFVSFFEAIQWRKAKDAAILEEERQLAERDAARELELEQQFADYEERVLQKLACHPGPSRSWAGRLKEHMLGIFQRFGTRGSMRATRGRRAADPVGRRRPR